MIEDAPHRPDPTERRQLLDVLARAFLDNPMNVEIHGGTQRRRLAANRAGLRAVVLDCQDRLDSRVITHNGRVVCGLLVAPPTTPHLPSPSLWRQIGCLYHQGARAMDRWGWVSHQLAEHRPLEPHWYLAVLGVDPEQQGRGLGARLLADFLGRVERAPAPIHLECDREESVRFYLSRGFRVRSEAVVHGVRCRCLGFGFADETANLCDPVR